MQRGVPCASLVPQPIRRRGGHGPMRRPDAGANQRPVPEGGAGRTHTQVSTPSFHLYFAFFPLIFPGGGREGVGGLVAVAWHGGEGVARCRGRGRPQRRVLAVVCTHLTRADSKIHLI